MHHFSGLFTLAMPMLVKSAVMLSAECRGPITKCGIQQPPHQSLHGWLDCNNYISARGEMCFKAATSRSLVMKKGELVNKLCFSIEVPPIEKLCFSMGGTSIPTSKRPVKSLGKTYNCSMRDTASIQHSSQELKSAREVQSVALPAENLTTIRAYFLHSRASRKR